MSYLSSFGVYKASWRSLTIWCHRFHDHQMIESRRDVLGTSGENMGRERMGWTVGMEALGSP